MDKEEKCSGKAESDQTETFGKLVDSLNPLSGYWFVAKVIAVLAAVIVVYFGLARFGILPDIFKAEPVIIADTPVLINEVKGIAELFAVSQYHEVVVDSIIIEKSQVDQALALFDFDTYSDRSLVYIARGEVFAGFDLSSLNDSSFMVKDSALTIKLPAPKIIDVVANPDDFTLFKQTGEWSFEEVTALKAKAKDLIRKRAIDGSILQRSEKVGSESISAFYSALGFKKVNVEIVSGGY